MPGQRKGDSGPQTGIPFEATSAAIQVNANTSLEVPFTVTGAEVGDIVVGSLQAAVDNGLTPGQSRVTAANTVGMRIGNSTGGALPAVAAAQTARFLVFKWAALQL